MVVATRRSDRHGPAGLGHGLLRPAGQPEAAGFNPGQRGPLSRRRDGICPGSQLIDDAQRLVHPVKLAEDLGEQPVAPGPAVHVRRTFSEQPAHGYFRAVQLLSAACQAG